MSKTVWLAKDKICSLSVFVYHQRPELSSDGNSFVKALNDIYPVGVMSANALPSNINLSFETSPIEVMIIPVDKNQTSLDFSTPL